MKRDNDPLPLFATAPRFDGLVARLREIGSVPEPRGETYDAAKDRERLGVQYLAVKNLMSDGAARTLAQISVATGYPEASVSARLRDMRRDGWVVDRTRLEGGLHTYRAVQGGIQGAGVDKV